MKGCRGKFVCQDVHVSLSGGFASDVMSGFDRARDTWQDGEGRECRFVSIDTVNFKRDFLLRAAEEISRFKVNDQVQARVGGRQEVDGGRKQQEKSTANSRREKSTANSRREKSIANSRREKSTANSRREKSTANSRREGQEEAHHRPQVKESGEKLGRRRAGASSIVTRDRRESCEEAAVLKMIEVVYSQSRPSVSMTQELAFHRVGRWRRGRDPTSETAFHGVIYVVDVESRSFSFIHALVVSTTERHRVQRLSVTARQRERIPCLSESRTESATRETPPPPPPPHHHHPITREPLHPQPRLPRSNAQHGSPLTSSISAEASNCPKIQETDLPIAPIGLPIASAMSERASSR